MSTKVDILEALGSQYKAYMQACRELIDDPEDLKREIDSIDEDMLLDVRFLREDEVFP